MEFPYVGKKWVVFLIFIFLASFTFVTSRKIDTLREGLESGGEALYIPPSKYLKFALLGFDQLASDFYWLKAIQYIGDKKIERKKYPQLYPLLDLVTDLDPKYEYAYEVGGVILSVRSKRIDESIALLKKGDEKELGYWEIPFFLGFNYFYYLGDYTSAAQYISKASKMARSPAYLPKLAARLYAHAGSPETALVFLKEVYKNTKNEDIKIELEDRINEVIVERDILFLERAIDSYKDRYGEAPKDLSFLVSKRIIKELPREPFGGYYYMDSETMEIKSSVIKERLRVF